LPAHASTITLDKITIDDSNCTSSKGCYGMSWTLTINEGGFIDTSNNTYQYEAILSVTDVSNPSTVISAVDFKVSDSVDSKVFLASAPSTSTLASWVTSANNLTSGGCGGSGAGYVCSQSKDAADYNLASLPTVQAWDFYFNTSSPIFADLIGAHIGAKLVDLSKPGQLLSASYSVPEPGSLFLFGAAGLAALLFRRRVNA
jgi:hypothetical protein